MADFNNIFVENVDNNWGTDCNEGFQRTNTQIPSKSVFINVEPFFKKTTVDQLILLFDFESLIQETSLIQLLFLFSLLILIIHALSSSIMTLIMFFVVILRHFKNSWRVHFNKIETVYLCLFFIEKIGDESSFYFSFEGEFWRFYYGSEKTVKGIFGELLKLTFESGETL